MYDQGSRLWVSAVQWPGKATIARECLCVRLCGFHPFPSYCLVTVAIDLVSISSPKTEVPLYLLSCLFRVFLPVGSLECSWNLEYGSSTRPAAWTWTWTRNWTWTRYVARCRRRSAHGESQVCPATRLDTVECILCSLVSSEL